MIQLLSKLKVADNSGARLVQCIKVLKSRSKTACVGDLITVTVKKARPHKQVQKKKMFELPLWFELNQHMFALME